MTCVVCVAAPTTDTAYDLSEKFGCQPEEAPMLLKEVHKWKCQAGLSFHVGSQCLKLEAWKIALDTLCKIMDEAQVDIHMLDVGGGFPAACHGVQLPPLESFMDEIEAGLKQLDLRTNFNGF